MNDQDLKLFRESVTRCVADPDSCRPSTTASSARPTRCAASSRTRTSRSRSALADSLFSLAVALQTSNTSYTWHELDRVARRHSSADQDIRPELYDLWQERLIEAAARHDPEYSPEIAAAWRSALAEGVAFMRARY